MTTNKFKNGWFSTDSGLTGIYQSCSLLNEGKSEFKNDVVIDTRLAIGKVLTDIDINTYKLDINGDINFTGNLYNNGTLFSSSEGNAILTGDNSFTGSNTFNNLNFNNVSTNINIPNYNFASFPVNTITPQINSTSTTSTTTTLNDWSFTGTTFKIFSFNGSSSPDNRFIRSAPSNSRILCLEIVSGNSFILSTNNLVLSAGDYVLTWNSVWGNQPSSANITASIGDGAFTYNDSFTRSTAIWTSHDLKFAIASGASDTNLRFTYTDSTTGTLLDACFTNIVITKYNSLVVTNGTTYSFISPTLSQIRNPILLGNVNVIGTETVQGALNIGSTYGSGNLPLNNTFGSIVNSNNQNCLTIGRNIGISSTSSLNVVAIGNSVGSDIISANNIVTIGNTIVNAKTNDTFIGSNITASSRGNNLLMGYRIGFNAGGVGSYNVALGNSIFGGYNGYGSKIHPSNNVAIGYNLFSNGGYYDLYNMAFGNNVFNGLMGNNNDVTMTQYSTKYNIGIGYNVGTQSLLNDCIFIGSNTDSTVNNITQSVCLGSNSQCNASNQIVLGTSTETTIIKGNLNVLGTITFPDNSISASMINGLVNGGGTASSANTINTVSLPIDPLNEYYIGLNSTIGANQTIYNREGLYYETTTNTLMVNIVGNSETASVAIASQTSDYSTNAGNSLTSDYAINSGNASNASNISIGVLDTNVDFYNVLLASNSGDGQSALINSKMYYQPSTGSLTTTGLIQASKKSHQEIKYITGTVQSRNILFGGQETIAVNTTVVTTLILPTIENDSQVGTTFKISKLNNLNLILTVTGNAMFYIENGGETTSYTFGGAMKYAEVQASYNNINNSYAWRILISGNGNTSFTMTLANTQIVTGAKTWNNVNNFQQPRNINLTNGTYIYKPFAVMPALYTTSQNWNNAQATGFYFATYVKIGSLGANITFTLPQTDNAMVFAGMEFIFRRYGSTANTLSFTVETNSGDSIFGLNSASSATLPVVGLASGQIQVKLVCSTKKGEDTNTSGNWTLYPS